MKLLGKIGHWLFVSLCLRRKQAHFTLLCGNCVGLALKSILQNFTCLWVLRCRFIIWASSQQPTLLDINAKFSSSLKRFLTQFNIFLNCGHGFRKEKSRIHDGLQHHFKEMLRDGHKLDLTWCRSLKNWHRNVAAQCRYNPSTMTEMSWSGKSVQSSLQRVSDAQNQ